MRTINAYTGQPPKKIIHGEGDEMRATNVPSRTQDNTEHTQTRGRDACHGRVCGSRTQDNTREETHEEQDKMRTTKDKTNEKGKRKSEKCEALCEAENRKTKRKTDTKA